MDLCATATHIETSATSTRSARLCPDANTERRSGRCRRARASVGADEGARAAGLQWKTASTSNLASPRAAAAIYDARASATGVSLCSRAPATPVAALTAGASGNYVAQHDVRIETWPNSGKTRPTSRGSVRLRGSVAEPVPNLAQSGHIRSKVRKYGRNPANLAESAPNLAKIGPTPTEVAQNWSNLG